MLDGAQLKASGLRFARSLQVAVRSAVMFSAEHRSVERPIHLSFELLNALLKETGQFTIGFVDQQVLLNNVLTRDTSLVQLEKELLKRGIAAVTFEPGMTLGRYRRVIGILSAPAKAMEDAGGLIAFLENNLVEGVRILPTARDQKKDEKGDTIIETDSEAYILSKQKAEEAELRDSLESIDALLESACFDAATRKAMISGFATEAMGPSFGTPIAMPNLVVAKDGSTGETGGSAGAEGGSAQATAGAISGQPGANTSQAGTASGSSGTAGAGTGAGFGNAYPGGAGPGAGGGGEPGEGGSGFEGSGAGPARHPGGRGRSLGAGGYAHKNGDPKTYSFIDLVENSVERALLHEQGNPEKSYIALARIFRTMRLDAILGRFSPERREELRTLPPEQLAAEYIEDTALDWAGKRLNFGDGKGDKILVEEEVVRVLGRSLKATHMADRLAQKLIKLFQDFAVPPSVQQKIRDELRWTALSNRDKYSHLVGTARYSSTEFRRLTEYLRELVTRRQLEPATALATHYLEFLDQEGVAIEVEELSRLPDLLRIVPLGGAETAAKTVERLSRLVQRQDVSELVHFQAVNAMTVLAQAIAPFEQFDQIVVIGACLEASQNRNPDKHQKCCSRALTRLLPSAPMERLIELFLTQRANPAWTKTAATLLRLSGVAGVESVFVHLIKEEDSKNRLALLRLITLLGSQTTEVAQRYLKDERWYVVRNMCTILAELKVPELAQHILPALRHPDARVQQAALTALVKTHAAGSGQALAASLSSLASDVLDQALDELMYLKPPETVPELEEFIACPRSNAAARRKACQVLGLVPGNSSLDALARLSQKADLEADLRNTIATVLARRKQSGK